MVALAAIGLGEIILALTPAVNLVIAAAVWKWTGRTRQQIEGQGEQIKGRLDNQSRQLTRAKQEIQGDLRNGVAETLASIHEKVDAVSERVDGEIIPRLDRKRQKIEGIEQTLEEIRKAQG